MGLGLNKVDASKIKDPQAFNDLKELLAKTNPVSKESNQNVEKTIDRCMFGELKRQQNNKTFDVSESTRNIIAEVEAANKQAQSLRTNTNNTLATGRPSKQTAWKIHTPFVLEAAKNIQRKHEKSPKVLKKSKK